MKVYKDIKLIGISVLFLAVFVQARSVSNVGDIRSEKTDGKWVCDKIVCPVNTDRCFVSKSNEENRSVTKRVNICFSKDNRILAQHNSSSPTNTNNTVRQYVNFYSNGGVYTSGDKSAINVDEKAYNDMMRREKERMQSELNQMREEIAKMKNEMKNDFANRYDYY